MDRRSLVGPVDAAKASARFSVRMKGGGGGGVGGGAK